MTCPVAENPDQPCPQCGHAAGTHISAYDLGFLNSQTACLALGCRCDFDPAELGCTCGKGEPA